jgi:hypothetical protein
MVDYDYSTERKRYLPRARVKILFVGESAPDPGARQVRFFYHSVLQTADNLFRGIMLALYEADKQALASIPKTHWLKRFQDDGHYLEDLCDPPVDRLPPSQRSRARRDAVPGLLKRIEALSPQGIIVCHVPTFKAVNRQLRELHLPILHRDPIPFPLGSHRARLVEAVRAAICTSNECSFP